MTDKKERPIPTITQIVYGKGRVSPGRPKPPPAHRMTPLEYLVPENTWEKMRALTVQT